jgi:hypothetical protein
MPSVKSMACQKVNLPPPKHVIFTPFISKISGAQGLPKRLYVIRNQRKINHGSMKDPQNY